MAGWPGLLVVRAAKPQEAAVDLKLSFNFGRFMRSLSKNQFGLPFSERRN